MGDIPYEVLQQGGWVGPRFRGVFFFRDVFWRVVVPLVWGTRSINALDGLAVMPAQIKQRLVSVPKTRDEYLLLWADCVDYDMGFQDLAECGCGPDSGDCGSCAGATGQGLFD